jgi:hypothetical protein
MRRKISKRPASNSNENQKVLIIIAIIGAIETIVSATIGIIPNLVKPISEVTITASPNPTSSTTGIFLETMSPSATFSSNSQTPALTPTLLVLKPHSDPSDYVDLYGVPMRLIPAGEFIMGTNNGPEDERPIHLVYLDAFYIDKFEVIDASYRSGNFQSISLSESGFT